MDSLRRMAQVVDLQREMPQSLTIGGWDRATLAQAPGRTGTGLERPGPAEWLSRAAVARTIPSARPDPLGCFEPYRAWDDTEDTRRFCGLARPGFDAAFKLMFIVGLLLDFSGPGSPLMTKPWDSENAYQHIALINCCSASTGR